MPGEGEAVPASAVALEVAPLLSVVIPTFRRPAMLREALRSVLANGFSAGSLEVVVSDDDPQESARAVVESAAGDVAILSPERSRLTEAAVTASPAQVPLPPAPVLRYVSHAAAKAQAARAAEEGTARLSPSAPSVAEAYETYGGKAPIVLPPGHPAPNWDFGARQARGEFLFKLDDDDVIVPGFLARCVAFLQANPTASCVYTAHVIADTATGARYELVDTTFFGPPARGGHGFPAAGSEAAATLVPGAAYAVAVLCNEGGYPVNHKTIGMCRTEAARRIDFYALAAEDFANSAALGLVGDVGYIPHPLYEYRMHGANAMTTDLFRVWRFSSHALDGLDRLEAGLRHPQLGPRWRAVVGRCREALPLFYLFRAFRDQSRAAAWELWGRLRTAGAFGGGAGRAAEWKGWCLLIAGTLTPGPVRQAAFEIYRRSGALRSAIARGLGMR